MTDQLAATPPGPSTPGPSTPRPSIWTGLRPVLAEAARRRLNVRTLQPSARRGTTIALGAVGLSGLMVMSIPLGIDLPGGSIPLLRGDAPPISRLHLAVTLLAIGAGMAALATGALQPGWRLRRATLMLIAVAELLMVPVALGLSLVPPAIVAISVGALVASALLFLLALLGRGLRRGVVPALAAAPPVLALLAVFSARLTPLPDDVERLYATQVTLGITGVQGLFVVLAAWAAIEYSRALTAGSIPAIGLRSARWVLLPAVLAAKLIWILVGSAGLLPAMLMPRESTLTILGNESLLSVGLALGLAGAAAWWLLRQERRDLSVDGATAAGWLLATPILVAFILPQLALSVLATLQRFDLLGPETTAALAGWVDVGHTLAVGLGPVAAVVLALIVGVTMLRLGRNEHRTAGLFLLAFVAWAGVPSATYALNSVAGLSLVEGSGGILGNVHPVTLDLALTLVVCGLLVAWQAGLQRAASPPILLAVLLVSTVVAYGGLLAGAFAVVVFWLGLAFPVVAQFAFDAERLNESGPGREARVLGAVGMAALATAFSLPMLAIGFVGPDDIGTGELFRVLFVVPFTAVLLAAVIQRHRHPAAGEGSDRRGC